MNSNENFSVKRANVENTFTSLSLVLVEVPCGFTAAAIVCLTMAIQEVTLSDQSMELDASHRIHATVMSLMSLVCWVHNASVSAF